MHLLEIILLCSSVAVPQICGGLGPPGFEIEKTSVKHLEASDEALPPAATDAPAVVKASVVVTVVMGPFITKVMKSSLS